MNALPLTPEHWLHPAIHPVYARLVCAELRRRGFSEADITAGTRLDWEALHSDNRFLSFEQFRRLVAHALALSGCPWLGLEVGINAQLSLHGALGQAVAASSSVEEALLLCQRYMPLRQRIFGVSIEAGDPVCIVAAEQIEVPDLREFMLGYLTATLVRLMEAVTGQPLQDEFAIEWPFPEPAWAEQYRRLAIRNSFGHGHLRAKVSATLLQRRSLSADPEARRVAERECERQLKVQQQGGNLTQRIQQRLASCQGAYPGIVDIAADENVSSRTLIRHLRDEGTTYQQLLDTVREELACWLLLQSDLPVEAIAERLGYEDTSNFSRTFRRWVGVTPRDFRASAPIPVDASRLP
ncbi:MAG: AraC family transcriptional regulator ligand-binding domain-containing protein [Gammaproteobacteria bacterium]